MSYPSNLTEHERKLWSLAMQWPVPAGISVGNSLPVIHIELRDIITTEPSTAHGCPMCSDGQAHTLYLHEKIIKHLIDLDRDFKEYLYPKYPKQESLPSSASADGINPFKSHSKTGEK